MVTDLQEDDFGGADFRDGDFGQGGFEDAELRRALAPLAGDPVADMERVMAALPVPMAPSRGGPLSRLAPWIGLATAAGLVVGFLAARLMAPAIPESVPPHPTGDPQIVAQASPDAPARLVVRRGKVFVETDDGPKALDVGDRVAVDEFFVAEKREESWGPMWANTALLSFPDKVEVRILGGTKMAVGGPRSLTLVRGEVCVVVPETAGPFRVVTNDGDVSGRGSTFQVASGGDGDVVVVAFEGAARFEDLTGASYEVPGRRVLRVVDGMVEEPEAIDLVWSYAAWQAQMLYLCSERREEALSRAMELVEGLADPKLAATCERALRGAGMLGEEALMVGLVELAPQRESLRRRAALLLSDVGSLMSIRYHLGMLTEEDPDLRVAGFRAFERTTGIDTGLEPGFWREAPPAERFGQVQRLREMARQY